jgi:CheY-like chemotaxis protein
MTAKTVLVVEDNPLNMELTTDVLEVAGFAVCQAFTAEEGIELARSARPDLVLMDVSLPGMDGLTATGILKADATLRSIPVVALTAHAMSGDRERVLAAGCDGYITKPIDTRGLVGSVSAFFGGDRA